MVLNRGRGGETTGDGLARLPEVLASDRPGVVLLLEGTNDALAGVRPGLIVAHLREMVRQVRAAGAIPPLGTVLPDFAEDDIQARATIAAVNAQLLAVAAEEEARLVDTFAALNDPLLMGEDGFHPNQAGYDALARAWFPAVLGALEPLLLATLPGTPGLPGPEIAGASVAAGPTRLLLARGDRVELRDRAGAPLAEASLAALFAPVTALPPRQPAALFDAARGRFVIAAAADAHATNPGCPLGSCRALLLGVSRTDQPASLAPPEWHLAALDRRSLQTPAGPQRVAEWGEGDRLAVSGAVLTVTWQAFRFVDGAPVGPRARFLNLARLAAGEAVTTWVDLVDLAPADQTVLPAITTSDREHVFLVSRLGCGYRIVGVRHPLGTPGVVSRDVGVEAGPCPAPPDVPQPGGAPLRVATAGLATQPVYEGGSLWIADTIAGDVGTVRVTGLRWFQVGVGAWPDEVAVLQGGLYGAEGVAHLAPALAVDPTQNLTVLYLRAGPNEPLGAWVTGRRATDPPNALRPGRPLQRGIAPLGSADATGPLAVQEPPGAALDPADGTAWLLGRYADPAGRRPPRWRGSASPPPGA